MQCFYPESRQQLYAGNFPEKAIRIWKTSFLRAERSGPDPPKSYENRSHPSLSGTYDRSGSFAWHRKKHSWPDLFQGRKSLLSLSSSESDRLLRSCKANGKTTLRTAFRRDWHRRNHTSTKPGASDYSQPGNHFQRNKACPDAECLAAEDPNRLPTSHRCHL